MKIKINGEIKKMNLLSMLVYIELIFVIYLSGTVAYVKYSSQNSNIYYASLVLMILSFIPVFLKELCYRQTVKQFLVSIAIMLVIIVFTYIIHPDTVIQLSIRLIWLLIFSYAIKYLMRKNVDWLGHFYNIIVVLAVISLILYVLICLLKLPIEYSTLIIRSDLEYKNYFNIFYLSYAERFGSIELYRMDSCFWEPGIYQIYLNLAIFYYVFFIKEQKKWQFVILILNLAATFSTVGIIIGVGLLFCQYIKGHNYKLIRKLLIIPIFTFVVYISYAVYTYKKVRTNFVMGSYSLRMDDMLLGLQLLKKYFWFGSGFLNTDEYSLLQGLSRGNSNGLVSFCFTMGIFGIIFAALPFIWNYLGMNGSGKIRFLIYFVIILISNAAEPLYSAPLMVFILSAEFAVMLTKK